MPPIKDSIANWHRSNPNQALALGIAVLIIGASLWVGIQARRTSNALRDPLTSWRRASDQLATVQQQFRVPTATESAALIAESARLGALGVPPEDKLNLVESVGRLAEAYDLAQVRANTKPASDSAFAPAREIGTEQIKPADYAITLEFTGSFAGLVQFVSNLPPSVSVSQVRAARRGTSTVYQVILLVYELDAGKTG